MATWEGVVIPTFVALAILNFFIRRPQPTEWGWCKNSAGEPRCKTYALSLDQAMFQVACDIPINTFVGFYIFLSFFWQYNQAIGILGNGFDRTENMIWLALICGAGGGAFLFLAPGFTWTLVFMYSILNVWLSQTLTVSRSDRCVDPACFWVRWSVIFFLALASSIIIFFCVALVSDNLKKLHRSISVGFSVSLSTALLVDGIDDHFSDGWTHTAIVFGILIVVIAVCKVIYDKWVVEGLHNACGDNNTECGKFWRILLFPAFCSYKFDVNLRKKKKLVQPTELEPMLNQTPTYVI